MCVTEAQTTTRSFAVVAWAARRCVMPLWMIFQRWSGRGHCPGGTRGRRHLLARYTVAGRRKGGQWRHRVEDRRPPGTVRARLLGLRWGPRHGGRTPFDQSVTRLGCVRAAQESRPDRERDADPMTLRVLAGWRERLEAELGRPLHQDDYSTEHQARVGPRECSRLTDHHNAMVRAALLRHRGHEVKTTGDGFLATFDATGRALRCPAEIVRGAKDIWLELRAGVHTGEVEVRGDDIAGLAVTIAKRICDLSGPGQVLVSETARGHMVGNGSIQFRV